MMIGPETYYEMNLKGKNAEQITGREQKRWSLC